MDSKFLTKYPVKDFSSDLNHGVTGGIPCSVTNKIKKREGEKEPSSEKKIFQVMNRKCASLVVLYDHSFPIFTFIFSWNIEVFLPPPPFIPLYSHLKLSTVKSAI